MSSARFPRDARLTARPEFDRVFEAPDCKSSDACFTLLARRNDTGAARLGLALSKRNIRTSVARNRIKRLVRESFRHHCEPLAGLDIIVLARTEATAHENRALVLLLEKHWQRVAQRCASSSSP